jgi:hypothetical protein
VNEFHGKGFGLVVDEIDWLICGLIAWYDFGRESEGLMIYL